MSAAIPELFNGAPLRDDHQGAHGLDAAVVAVVPDDDGAIDLAADGIGQDLPTLAGIVFRLTHHGDLEFNLAFPRRRAETP